MSDDVVEIREHVLSGDCWCNPVVISPADKVCCGHASDCAVHNAPDEIPGPCDCGRPVDVLLSSRSWLQKALKANGAILTGSGLGCGSADVDIELNGRKFVVSIRQRMEIGSFNEKSFAFSDALALESVTEELAPIASDALIRYAKIIAYKVYHNLKEGFPMNPDDDPVIVGDMPAPIAWSNHY